MKNRLLVCLFLLFSFQVYSQCTLNVVLTQPSVAICAGNVATLNANGGDSYTWYNAASGGSVVGTGQSFTTPVLTTSTTYYVVVSANGCSSSPLAVAVNVTPYPQPPAVSNVSICAGSSASLHADGASTVFNWFASPSGGIALISSPDYTTPPLSATTTYYVETEQNGCESSRVPVTVTVNPIPGTPTGQTDTVCYGSNTTLALSGVPSATLQWFDAVSGGTLLTSGSSYTTPALTNSTTYYVQSSNGECSSTRVAVNVIVRPQLPQPTAAGAIICNGTSATLTAGSSGGTFAWYDAASGGNLLSSAATYVTPPLTANTTYYVQYTSGGCVSPRAAVAVTVLAAVTPPSAAGTSVCPGDAATLTASGSSGSYAWYDAATGGNLVSSTAAYTTGPLSSTTTYYVETTVNGCTSTRTPVTVTINAIPSPPTASGTSVCPNSTVTLTASGSGTITWYDAATGGNLLATGSTFTTPPISANTTYYVQNAAGQCASSRTAVTVSTISLTNPQFQYPAGTFCIAGPNPTPVINNPAGGVFSAAPSGLVFVDNTTGQINLAASLPGKYNISFASGGQCPEITSASVTVTIAPDATFSFNDPFCQGGTNPSPTFGVNASAGIFSAAPSGLVFVNTSTGEINLAASTPGAYTVTNSIPATAGCPATSATANVTINPGAIVNAGPSQTVNAGSTVQLAGSITGSVTTGAWSGGTGTFSDPTLPNAVYTPGPGETSATLTLTSSPPGGPCGPRSSTVVITITPGPPNPTAAGASVCNGTGATLTATAPGGTYQWYDAAANGNLLFTGPSFITPPLTVSTTYYVQTTINNATTGRTAVTVTVNAIPSAPASSAAQICSGSQATLIATGSAGTYEWYDAATGGNLLSTSDTYVTPVLTAGASFYVQSIVNGCISTRTKVDVSILPVSNVTSAATAYICSGNAQNYTITADLPGTTFTWSRPQVNGISNAAISAQTSATITEALINTTNDLVKVTYVITPVQGSCPGPSFNYVVTVYPTPVVTSASKVTICDFTPVNYSIQFNTPSFFSWRRAAVAGVSNASISGQTSNVIREVLFNTTNNPVDVTYIIDSQTNTCTGIEDMVVVTVEPNATITGPASANMCTASTQNYTITSSIPTSTFLWSRDAVAGISNPPVSNQTSASINETLINTTNAPIRVPYIIVPMAYGCAGTTFVYAAIVNPQITAPNAASNSPVCVSSSLQLSADSVAGETFAWTGPNGFTSAISKPVISNVNTSNAGDYTLVVGLNGCISPPATVNVVVDPLPVATAGPDQKVCVSIPSIQLAGTVTGGVATGVWTTSGSGTFSPSATALNALYIPSGVDRAADSVKLTLSSTSNGNCSISTSAMEVRFGPVPAVDAGPDQTVCAENGADLKGSILVPGGGTWSTSGTGTFSPSASQLNAHYIPGAADVKNGKVTLTLTADATSDCYIPTDDVTINVIAPPVVFAGGTKYVLKDGTITLKPVVNESNVTYQWTPDINISDTKTKDPVITGDVERTYTLIVTDANGCSSSDEVVVKVAPPLKIDNTFTPNNDGINDFWDVVGLSAYPQATVDIFTRYGTKVFHSIGYDKPFDGTLNGQNLPVGVYYYVIDTKLNNMILSGYITIIR